MTNFRLITALAFLALFVIDPAMAQDAADGEEGGAALTGQVYEASLQAITILLVIAVLVESALEVLFNWRVFRAYFSISGVKTLINFGVSLLIVIGFGIDVMSTLLNVYTPPPDYAPNIGTQVLTALIIAGGSSGVNNLLAAFGYRNQSSAAEDTPVPQKNTAWIAVRVKKKAANAAVQIHVTEEARPPAGLTSIAGTCMTGRPSLISLLMRNNDRFPQNGGYSVPAEQAFRISVSSVDKAGEPISKMVTPDAIKLAGGAIVDFDVEL